MLPKLSRQRETPETFQVRNPGPFMLESLPGGICCVGFGTLKGSSQLFPERPVPGRLDDFPPAPINSKVLQKGRGTFENRQSRQLVCDDSFDRFDPFRHFDGGHSNPRQRGAVIVVRDNTNTTPVSPINNMGPQSS